MMLEFKPAVRQNVPLLIGIAGPSGSGKTLSALRLASGLSAGHPFAAIDTESGRMLHYADSFNFMHADLAAPFSPDRYWQAIANGVKTNPPVIVVDSFSHEHAGEGGVLDMHEQELQRMAGEDARKREAMKFAAWIKPKKEHKRLIAKLLQLPVHLIVCLRAEEKVDIVKRDGKIVVEPKRTLSGHVGWIPICGKDLPYELTISLVVSPDRPGVPVPIKLQEQHRPLIPLDSQLDESVGVALAQWAKGGTVGEALSSPATPGDEPVDSASPTVLASPDQRKMLWHYAKENGLTADDFKTVLMDIAGVTSGKDIPLDKVDDILERVTA